MPKSAHQKQNQRDSDSYSQPKSSKQVVKKAEPSESNAYTQEDYEDDYSQDPSQKPISNQNQANALQSQHKPDISDPIVSGGINLANPPSMAQLERDSRTGSKLGAKTDRTHPQQQVHQDTVQESGKIMVANDSNEDINQKEDQNKYTYHKLDKEEDIGSEDGKSNEEFFLDEDKISVDN